ncbi:MAG: HEAT repeat domain-containing protein [bacterium]
MKMRSLASLLLVGFLSIASFPACAPHSGAKPHSSRAANPSIATLHTSRNITLYYEEAHFPENVKELILLPGNIDALIGAYQKDKKDNLYRFNIIMILNKKIEYRIDEGRSKAIEKELLKAIHDPDPWVRTEAVWGLGNIGNTGDLSALIPLLDDPDDNVLNETVLSLSKLSGLEKSGKNSNMDLQKKDRGKEVEFWKGWWKQNQQRY